MFEFAQHRRVSFDGETVHAVFRAERIDLGAGLLIQRHVRGRAGR